MGKPPRAGRKKCKPPAFFQKAAFELRFPLAAFLSPATLQPVLNPGSAMTTPALVPRSLHDFSYAALEQALVGDGLSATHTRALWRALHREASAPLGDRTDFSPPLRHWIAQNLGARFVPESPAIVADTASSDGLTRKFLLRLDDGQTIETVLMSYTGRHTACVSTQAGCAMGCVFCATGQMGFVRHLRPGEIVAQVLHAQRSVPEGGALRNLVLMGMGEPLHNYDSVMTALEIICDSRGINLGPSRITISTVGVVPGILRLAEEKRPYHLAVSLHGASEEERGALVPASKRWPLADVIAACRTFGGITGRKIFFEWTLIAGANDSPETACRLGALLAGIRSHVNLIPLNPTNGFAGHASAAASAIEFQRVLREAAIPSTIRQRRGIDVAAGCGMLRAEKSRRA
jgi:23S rRNA (adenine2503-C2)-methyltransferase